MLRLLAAATIMSTSICGVSMASTAPAPHVLAWASFLGPDGPITSSSTWSSGQPWVVIGGASWTQIDGAAVPARSTVNARAVATVAAAGDGARVVAIVSTRDGTELRAGGVVASASTSGAGRSLLALVDLTGALEIREVPGAPSVLLASSSPAAVTGSSVELSLQKIGSTVVATARPMSSSTPTVVVTATLSPSAAAGLAGNTGYGMVAHLSTGVSVDHLRVEIPA